MKFIIILGILIYVVPYISKYLIRAFITKQVNKVQSEFKKNNTASPKKEGEVKVDYAPKNENKEHLKGGEYVDYEEVK